MKNKKVGLIFLAIIFFGVFGMVKNSHSANHYIMRDCANSGDGSSWLCAESLGGTGAWNNMPAPGTQYDCGFDAATWIKGDTYYLAGSDASYRQTCIGRNTTGNGIITIKKATTSDHGINTGWQASYGTKQAILGSLNLDSSMTSGVLISGASRADFRSGYGFKIISGTGANTYGIYGNSNLTLEYTEITSPNIPIVDNCIDLNLCADKGVHTNGDNIIVRNNWIHDVSCPFQIGSNNGFEISNNVVERNDSVPAHHSEAIAANGNLSNLTVNNNIWVDIEGTAFFAFMNGGTKNAINIFNNVSYYTAGSTQTGNGNGWLTCTNAGTICSNFNIFSNTMANLQGLSASVNIGSGGTVSNWVVKNNLWWCSGTCAPASNSVSAQIIYDKNWHGGISYNNSETGTIDGGVENPFSHALSYDFSLKSGATPINAGATLISRFNSDFRGISRPQGSAWDIGAYEYSSDNNNTTPPAAPSGLLIQ